MQYLLIIFSSLMLTCFAIEKSVKLFHVLYLNKIDITGIYEEDPPELVTNVKCKINGHIFYEDTLGEYEFHKSIWQSAKHISDNKYQVLLEMDDRPNKSKIVLLTVENNKLTSKQILPTFDSSFKKEDGLTEYLGSLENAESLDDPHKTQYIPTIFYTDNPQGLVLDTIRTIAYNRMKWGKFYGFKPNFKLILKR